MTLLGYASAVERIIDRHVRPVELPSRGAIGSEGVGRVRKGVGRRR